MARRLSLDTKIAKFCQGDKTVLEDHNGFLTLWMENDTMLLASVSLDFLPQALKLQEEARISQFLMNLHSEFELVRSVLMNRKISPDLETSVREVICEKTHQ